MSALVLDRVSKVRGRGAHAVSALAEVSLRLEAGEVVLLEGPSGSGKTTLLTVAAGLLSVDAGEVVLAGRRLAELDARARRAHRARSVGFVFQRANLLEALAVRDNVLLAAALAGLPRARAERETARLLTALGIERLAQRLPEHLSGGEEHRVAVARALVHAPSVVFADEPTASLDGVSGRAVARLLVELAKGQGVAVLVASHDLRLHEFVDRRLSLSDGRLVVP